VSRPVSSGACDACVARSRLLSELSGHLEHSRSRIEEVLALGNDELLAGLAGERRDELAAGLAGLDVEAERERARAVGLETICRCDPAYPPSLRGLAAPPAVLHVAGGRARLLELVARDAVAIVGSRRATPYGIEVARSLARGLASCGVTVISGMALGIDAAAHAGALAAAVDEQAAATPAATPGASPAATSAATVAVLPGAASDPYPRSKRALHRRLVATGAVVSELPPGSPVRRWTFPARNRLIAALARMTVVVEAGERSGSLVTARIAGALGRVVGAVPGRVTAPQSASTNALLAAGAHVVRGPQDVLEALFGADAPAPTARPAVRRELAALLDALGGGLPTAHALARSGLGAHDGLAALAELELSGHVRRAPGGGYVVIPP